MRTMLVSLAVVVGACAVPPRAAVRVAGAGPCTNVADLEPMCGPCADGPTRAVSANEALVRDTLAALIIAEGRRGLMTNLDVDAGSTRFYRLSTGAPLTLPAGAPAFASRLAELDDDARARPFEPVFFIELAPVGVAFGDYVFVQVTVTDHTWLADRGVFFDEVVTSEYCLRRRAGLLDFHTVTPPLHLS